LVTGVLGHVSARVAEDELIVRCRGPRERGLAHTEASDVWRLDLDGREVDVPDGWRPPNELAIHTELMRARPDVGAVIHAHPREALLCGLAGLPIRPVFGAFNVPAMRLARSGVPVYRRPILITRPELAAEMVEAMEGRSVCLLAGHGITVSARTVEEATVLAVDLNALLTVTVELARLGAHPPEIGDEDLTELPDLGGELNTAMAWRALMAELDGLQTDGGGW
jgi:3,4-dihydroxyphthalate decarboxylase